jgi:hypothetical protein
VAANWRGAQLHLAGPKNGPSIEPAVSVVKQRRPLKEEIRTTGVLLWPEHRRLTAPLL